MGPTPPDPLNGSLKAHGIVFEVPEPYIATMAEDATDTSLATSLTTTMIMINMPASPASRLSGVAYTALTPLLVKPFDP